MSALLQQLSLIVTGDSTAATPVPGILTWVTDVAAVIVAQPILLLTTGFLVLGGAIGIFGRLLSKN